MRRSSVIRSVLGAALTAAVLALGALPVAADGGGRPFTVTLTGAAEAPVPGDPDGSGTASLRLNPGQGEVCFDIQVQDVAPLTAAHIHVGPAGVAGPVVVPLGTDAGCVTAERDLIRDIIRNPSNYYVNVHNMPFPAGALRGQLG
jgi:hypothetical protein